MHFRRLSATVAVAALCTATSAQANIIPLETLAIFDAPSLTGTPIYRHDVPTFQVGTFVSAASASARGGSLNNAGKAAFHAIYAPTSGAPNIEGILTATIGGNRVETVNQASVGARLPVIASDGAIAWETTSDEIGLTLPDGTASRIVRHQAQFTPAYTFGSTTNLSASAQAGPPSVSNTHVVFQAVATDDRDHCTRPGACYSGDSEFAAIRYDRATEQFEVLLREPENPQTQSGRFVENLENMVVNDSGEIAFMGRYNPPGGSGFSGLYPADTVWAIAVGTDLASARVVMKGGDAVPDRPGLSIETLLACCITTTRGPALNNNGQVAFLAPTTSDAKAGHSPDGLFLDDGVDLSTIALLGESAPGGGTFDAFGNLHISDTGQIAFTAGLADGEFEYDHEALYATDKAGQLRRIVRIGDDLEVTLPDGSKDVKELTRIDLAHEKQKSFNDDGRLIASAYFTDGSNAIIAFEIAGEVPLPAGLPVMVTGLALLVGVGRKPMRHG